MPAEMRLGFVVLNWNGRRQLEQGLGSVVVAARPSDLCIVVDNASSDGSVDWIRAHHPGVEVITLESNRRFAGGNNVGAARAIEKGADVVVLVNNDTILDPGVAEAVEAAFTADSSVGIVGLRIVHAADPTSIWYGGGRLRLGWGLVSHRALRKNVASGIDREGATDWVTGCFLAVRSELWSELEGLDESYYIYSEDVDFNLRATRAGWRVHYTPRASLRHDVSSTVGGAGSAFKAYHKVRSRWQFFGRYGEGVLWPLGVLATDLVEVFRSLVSRSPAAVRAVIQAWYDAGPGQRTGESSFVRYRTEDLARTASGPSGQQGSVLP